MVQCLFRLRPPSLGLRYGGLIFCTQLRCNFVCNRNNIFETLNENEKRLKQAKVFRPLFRADRTYARSHETTNRFHVVADHGLRLHCRPSTLFCVVVYSAGLKCFENHLCPPKRVCLYHIHHCSRKRRPWRRQHRRMSCTDIRCCLTGQCRN